LLVETGDQASVSIRAIAKAAGVTPPSIYLHFADKEGLLLEVCNRRFAEMNRRMDEAGAAHDDPVEALGARGRAYIRFALENPEHYRVLMLTKGELREPGDEGGPAQGRIAFDSHVEAVTRCIESGAFRPDDPFAAAIDLWAGVHGLSSLLITLPGFPWPETDATIEHLMESQVKGFLA